MKNDNQVYKRKQQKFIYFAIVASIIFLNILVLFKYGVFNLELPDQNIDFSFLGLGFLTLLSSLFVPKVLKGGDNENSTMLLLHWALLEMVVTIGFIHCFMVHENYLLYYTVPALFQMYKSYPRNEE